MPLSSFIRHIRKRFFMLESATVFIQCSFNELATAVSGGF